MVIQASAWDCNAGTDGATGIVDSLSSPFKKAMAPEDHQNKHNSMGLNAVYKDPPEFAVRWVSMEDQVRPLMELAKC